MDARTMGLRGRPDNDPAFMNLLQHMDAFYDNERAFRTYLKEIGLQGTAARHGLATKTRNTVIPEVRSIYMLHTADSFSSAYMQRIGYPMSTQPKAIPPYSKDDWYLLCESSLSSERLQPYQSFLLVNAPRLPRKSPWYRKIHRTDVHVNDMAAAPERIAVMSLVCRSI